jgi:hypothetical protein
MAQLRNHQAPRSLRSSSRSTRTMTMFRCTEGACRARSAIATTAVHGRLGADATSSTVPTPHTVIADNQLIALHLPHLVISSHHFKPAKKPHCCCENARADIDPSYHFQPATKQTFSRWAAGGRQVLPPPAPAAAPSSPKALLHPPAKPGALFLSYSATVVSSSLPFFSPIRALRWAMCDAPETNNRGSDAGVSCESKQAPA